MVPIQAVNKKFAKKSKENFYDLENKIFESVCSNQYFKSEILYPFAVLENDSKKVVLGSNAYVSNRVNDSILLQMELEKIVSDSLGGVKVGVDLKKANNEFLATQKRIDDRIEKAKKEEQALLEIEEQKIEGKCKLIPFPVKENKVRSDLTIERHALFAANTFKGDFRTHERKIRDPKTGEISTLRVEIGDPTGHIRGAGVLKQKHQEAFYKLSQIWAMENYQIKESKEKLSGYIELSPYDLVQKLRGDSGGRTYKQALQLLTEMSVIRVNIKKLNINNKTCSLQNFTLLSYEWDAKDFNEETIKCLPGGKARVRINFSDFITNNFLRKNIKSLTLGPYLSLRDHGRKGVAQLLYTMLDYELSTKDRFNISLVKLCKRLGLAQYGFKSKRKEKLKGSIDAVNGTAILGGKHRIDCYLTESGDGKDWILIAQKIS